MTYCFLKWVPAADGHGMAPDCPGEVHARLLTSLGNAGWGIFEASHDESWLPENPVDKQLSDLIDSGKRYPPALAISGHEMKEVFGEETPSQVEFARAYARALKAHLSKQHEAPYILAPALNSDAGYLWEGEWYWVLRVTGSPPRAEWVSDDYFLCENDVNDFDLTGQQLKRLGYMG